MSITMILRVLTIAYALVFAVVLAKDCIAHKEDFKGRKHFILCGIGFVTNFLDTLGIGSFATTQASFKLTKASSDEIMPGTLNVGDCIPVMTEFILFLGLIEVDAITLVAMIGAAIVGSLIGARIVAGWSVKVVRIALGCALIFLAAMMACRLMGVGPFGIVGTATGLYGLKLIIAVVINFFLGALMTIGVGLYTPCIALCSALGLNVKIAFPVMFGSCAFLMPSCGLSFIKSGKYDRVAAVWMTIAGIVGIFVAYYIIKELPLTILTWIIIAVMIYTSIMFLRDAFKKPVVQTDAEIERTATEK